MGRARIFCLRRIRLFAVCRVEVRQREEEVRRDLDDATLEKLRDSS